MIIEIAEIRVREGCEAAFEQKVAEAEPLFRRAPGCLSMALRKMVEEPCRYQLVVGWRTIEDHTEGFQKSEDFPRWRALVGDFFAGPPTVSHWRDDGAFFP